MISVRMPSASSAASIALNFPIAITGLEAFSRRSFAATTVVLKPARTRVSGGALRRVLADAGVPPGFGQRRQLLRRERRGARAAPDVPVITFTARATGIAARRPSRRS